MTVTAIASQPAARNKVGWTMNALTASSLEQWIIDAVQEITARGRALGLPLIATCANISSTRPVTVRGNTPVAALFDHPQDAREYWLQADLALQNTLVTIFRWTAEPFYYDNGEIGGWRPFSVSPEFERQARRAKLGIRCCIVAPIHLPGGVIGAVGWGTDRPDVDVRQIFEQHAATLHVLALRFVSACNTAMYGEPQIRSYPLTRREVQCVKLAAAGKTDEEIATILDLATPTVRFHLKRAGEKLGESGRVRIVHHAAALGFIGMRL
jgi:LuxR family transcriptional regulator, quorum-sensing system regulator SdiA